MKILASIALLLAAALLAIGCGGDDDDTPTAEDYRSGLEGLCVEQRDLIAELPQRQMDENLESTELKDVADEYAVDFRTDVEDLDPPSNLEGAHAELVALLAEDFPDADVDEVRGLYERLSAVYSDLGATGCAEGIEATITLLDQAQQNLAPDDAQD